MYIMTKFTAIFTTIILLTFSQAAFPETLTIFAAASLQAPMQKVSDLFTVSQSTVEITHNFDSSGTLKAQIEEGAECDIFISAASKQINALEKSGLIDTSSRINLLVNKIVLVAPEGNPAGITSFSDLGTEKLTLIALGNSDVPAGEYAQEILSNMGLWDTLNREGKISFAGNVTEAALQVSECAVDCGIIYATDAATHGLTVISEPPEGTLKTPVIYPAAIIKASRHHAIARKFLDFLKGSQAQEIFASFGFSSAK